MLGINLKVKLLAAGWPNFIMKMQTDSQLLEKEITHILVPINEAGKGRG